MSKRIVLQVKYNLKKKKSKLSIYSNKVFLFFVSCLNVFFVLHLFAIIECLWHFDCSIGFILLDSVNLYCFSIFLIHFCYMQLFLTIDEFEVTWLGIQFSTFKNGIFWLLLSLFNFFLFIIFLRIFCFCFSIGLRFFLLCFNICFIILFFLPLFNFIFSFLINFILHKFLHLLMEIFK